MNPLNQPSRASRMQYANYMDPRAPSYRTPAIRPRSSRDSTPFAAGTNGANNNYDDDDIYATPSPLDARTRHHPARTYSERQLFFDETISTLFKALADAEACFPNVQDAFNDEIRGIRWYATQALIDSLWELRFEAKKAGGISNSSTSRRDSKAAHDDYDAEDSGGGSGSGSNASEKVKQVKQVRGKLEKALQAAAYGTRPTVNPKRRNVKQAQEKASIERTVSKLQTSGSQCLELLTASKKRFSQFEPLVVELRFLKQIIEAWSEFTGAREERGEEEFDEHDEDHEENY
ncbi:hypothetical protein BDV95DRAFT_602645 [Massariosphaeria phaeospora]|uniref:Uncharacterized protein n=1 Tax=Massariosphaeria phaeospora TaxID=100035 RepID=A0A7C8ID96_9PLEO|nr:hypothetical protein BDV95DRAFT_602645 [Massariosphaeria phaeospora]